MRKYLAIGVFTLLGSFATQAADLTVVDDSAPIDTSLVNSSIYVQLLGGVSLPLDVGFGEIASYATDPGFAFAGTVGVMVLDGLSLEGDLMVSARADSAPFEDYSHSSASLMANLKYTAHLTEDFSVYVAAGLGWINYNEYFQGDQTYGGSGAGYQLIVGAGYKVASNVSIVAEYRYQNSFDFVPLDAPPGYGDLDFPVSAVLAGVKLGF